MFSLIITIISIALVTALALATIYYGGSAFRSGGDAAKAAQLINEGQQLSGGAAINVANSLAVTTQTAMVTNNALSATISDYADGVVTFGTAPVVNAFQSIVVTDAVCQKINDKALGATNSASIATNVLVTTPYGCYGATTVASGTAATTTASTGKVVFKY